MRMMEEWVQDVQAWLFGGKEVVEQRRRIFKIIESDPVLKDDWMFNRSHQEHQEVGMKKIHRIAMLRRSLTDRAEANGLRADEFEQLVRCLSEYDTSFGMRHGTHVLLFRSALRLQGTDEQWAEWGPRIDDYSVIGCFAMTELGHSSALRDLETTAAFDVATQQFEIRSPTLTSLKWWIGGSGHSATHAVVICQLLLEGASRGLAWFIVPLRCPSSGALLPGVECRELGPKPGRQGVDNGWIRFSGVRVPLGHMLMRWQQVSPDGAFAPPPHPALPYLSLIPERLVLIQGLVQPASMGAAIASRYASRRRHGQAVILDFPSLYTRLPPILAQAVAYQLCVQQALADWAAAADGPPEALLGLLPDSHAASAALKSAVGWWSADSLEECRRALGGHAYSLYNNLYQLIADVGVLTTGGGDNAALTEQALRHLLRSFRAALASPASPPSGPSVAYLASHDLASPSAPDWPRHLSEADLSSSPGCHRRLLEALVVQLLKSAHASGVSSSSSSSSSSELPVVHELWDAVRVHASVITLRAFAVRRQQAAPSLPPRLAQLELMASLSFLVQETRLLLLAELLPASSAKFLRKVYHDACLAAKPSILSWADLFDWPDFVLRSPLGIRDGDMYQHYFDTVASAPGATGQPPYWSQYIGKLTVLRASL